MYRYREVTESLVRFAGQYPIVTITGPRQSGKTTLARETFKNYTYTTLESPDIRRRALSDPRSFLESLGGTAIIDEIQRAPDILSFMQEYVDAENRAGMYIITGSAQFELLSSISQSLAGRSAFIDLLPFSLSEAYGDSPPTIESILYTGFYPRIFDKNLEPHEAMSFYTTTYLERDVRNLAGVRDLGQFEIFLKMCAGRTGQLLNLSSLANDCGVSHTTAKNWLSVLQASYIVQVIRPHFRNFNKRLIKTPKLHFVDSGLAAYLLDIVDPVQIGTHPLKGSLFETFVVVELLKMKHNSLRPINLYHWRDSVGHEIDCVIDLGRTQIPVEIKAGKTVNQDFFRNIDYYRRLNPDAPKALVVYGGNGSYWENDTLVCGFRDLPKLPELGKSLFGR